MSYTPSARTSLESALTRAIRDVGSAETTADMAGDEGACHDLAGIREHLTQIVRCSQQERRSALPKPIKGQTSIQA